MGTLTGVNHVATVTKDLDRLIGFYEEIFGAKCVLDVEVPHMVLRSATGPARHAFIAIGGPSVLHAWQITGVDPDQFDGEIFSRGRVDHFALSVDNYSDFERLRQTLVGAGASTGEINDFGLMISFSFQDPDGLWAEVCWWKNGLNIDEFDAGLMTDPIADKAGAGRE